MLTLPSQFIFCPSSLASAHTQEYIYSKYTYTYTHVHARERERETCTSIFVYVYNVCIYINSYKLIPFP